jgi:hypothetical protein
MSINIVSLIVRSNQITLAAPHATNVLTQSASLNRLVSLRPASRHGTDGRTPDSAVGSASPSRSSSNDVSPNRNAASETAPPTHAVVVDNTDDNDATSSASAADTPTLHPPPPPASVEMRWTSLKESHTSSADWPGVLLWQQQMNGNQRTSSRSSGDSRVVSRQRSKSMSNLSALQKANDKPEAFAEADAARRVSRCGCWCVYMCVCVCVGGGGGGGGGQIGTGSPAGD